MIETRILVKYQTRELLKQIGTKGQSYDQVINELIQTKNKKLLDSSATNTFSSNS
jgi:hypothetical protein